MRFTVVTLTACLVLNASAVHALSSDRDQPATIEAAEVEFDFRTGKRTYKGDVVVVQGTLRITGEKLVVQYSSDNEEIETATSWGDPATFKQRPDGKDHDIYGEGDEIVLNEIENTLTLIENAVMTQAGNSAEGNRIVYDMAADKMTVKGMEPRQRQEDGETAATESEDGRARVTITPEEQQSSGSGISSGSDTGDEPGDAEASGDGGTSGAGQGAE